MNEENKPTTRYIVVEKTIKELEELTKSSTRGWAPESIYHKKIDLGEISEEQKTLQTNSSWRSREDFNIRLNNNDMWTHLQKVIEEEIFNNNLREKISDVIFDKIMNTKIVATIGFHGRDNGRVDLNLETNIGEVYNDDYRVYINNMQEFEDKLKTVRREPFYSNNDKEALVMLEEFNVGVYPNEFSDASDNVKRLIKKYIKNDLVYCVKQDKLIVPEEYISKGEKGIKDWQETKRSGNKNNSIEKKMLKDLYREKKRTAHRILYLTTVQIVKNESPYRWDIPNLQIDGLYNSSRIDKLVLEILGIKNRNDMLNVTEEDMKKKFKEYWKEEMKKACDRLDNYDYDADSNK